MRAISVSKDRRHLFVTLGVLTSPHMDKNPSSNKGHCRFKIFQMPLLWEKIVLCDYKVFFPHPVGRFIITFNHLLSAHMRESIVSFLIYGQRSLSGPDETINNVKLDAEM